MMNTEHRQGYLCFIIMKRAIYIYIYIYILIYAVQISHYLHNLMIRIRLACTLYILLTLPDQAQRQHSLHVDYWNRQVTSTSAFMLLHCVNAPFQGSVGLISSISNTVCS